MVSSRSSTSLWLLAYRVVRAGIVLFMNPSAFPALHARSIRQQFERRAGRVNQAEFLQREIERRMFDRLDLVKLQPDRLLDIGCGRGQGLAVLSLKYPQAFAVGLDFALPMLRQHRAAGGFIRGLVERLPVTLKSNLGAIAHRASGIPICADAQQIPLANASIDLLWSNLCWHWLVDPIAALQEWYRIIRPGGVLMFSSFGVDTGRELRDLGWPIPAFPDMHDIGDALAKNGFADPVMDSERLTLEYRDASRLMAECLDWPAPPIEHAGGQGALAWYAGECPAGASGGIQGHH